MRDVAVDVAAIIEAGTTFVEGVDLHPRRLPSQAKTDRVTVWVTEDFSAVEPFVSTSSDAVTVTCNVSIRGVAGRTGQDALRALAFAVFSAVHRADASPYVSILATELPTLEEDQADLPVYTFPVDCTFHLDSTGPLVILPPSGPLRVQSIGFPDGSTLTSAPEPVDLTDYVTKDGEQTLANKTLASPVVSGDMLPETAGQQALGSAARPWGEAHLGPVVVDQGNVSNQWGLDIINAGAGTSGIRITSAAGGDIGLGRTGNSWRWYTPNRTTKWWAAGRSYDNSPQGYMFSDRQPDRVAFAIVGATNAASAGARTADLLQLRPHEAAAEEESVTRIGANGEIETLAGVVLRSPNGTRYRITVADDGSLTTEPA